jgi:hypothetical protein
MLCLDPDALCVTHISDILLYIRRPPRRMYLSSLYSLRVLSHWLVWAAASCLHVLVLQVPRRSGLHDIYAWCGGAVAPAIPVWRQ